MSFEYLQEIGLKPATRKYCMENGINHPCLQWIHFIYMGEIPNTMKCMVYNPADNRFYTDVLSSYFEAFKEYVPDDQQL